MAWVGMRQFLLSSQSQAFAAGTVPATGASAPRCRCFAVQAVQKAVRRLRLKGLPARAFKRAPPPSLPKRALEHYAKVLQAHGGDAARAILEAPKGPLRPSPAPGKLTSEEKTRLVNRYLPEQQEMSQKMRKFSHKRLWRAMIQKNWERYNACLAGMRTHQIIFDEVTYNFGIFGALVNPRQEDELARQFLAEMTEEKKFHPALVRLQEGFLESYFELKEVDAKPSKENLLKVAKTFWAISVNFKRKRVQELRARLAEAAAEQRRLQAEGDALQVAEESEGEEVLSDGEAKPRIRFPGTRPRVAKGIHRGCGIPNRRSHRWKHIC